MFDITINEVRRRLQLFAKERANDSDAEGAGRWYSVSVTK